MTKKNFFKQCSLFTAVLLFPFYGKALTTLMPEEPDREDKLICIDKKKTYKSEHFFLHDFAKKIEYIKLETNDNCFIGKEHEIESIRATETDIFIIEFNIIYRFSRKNGKFLNQIGRKGGGPNEFASKQSVAIDQKKQEVLLHDIMKNQILIYSFDGIFRREVDIPEVSLLELIDENTFAATMNDPNSNTPGFGLYSLSDGKMIKKLSGYYTSRSGIAYRLVPKHTTPRLNKGEAFFSTYITDTIFAINKNERVPRYALLPPNNGKTTREKESCSTPFLLCETDLFANIHVYGVKGNSSYDSYIINKKTGAITKGFVVNKEYSGPIFPFNTGMVNEIAALHYAYRLKSREEGGALFGKLKEITKTLNEEDNPVIIIANF